MRQLLRLALVCCAAPLCFGFVSLHGTGDARLQVAGSTPGTPPPQLGVRYATAHFDTSATFWRGDGVFLRARFDSAQDTGTLTIDFDTRALVQLDTVMHLPSNDIVRVRYEERRNGEVVFAEDAVSGELRVTWRADRAPLLQLGLGATFRSARAGSAYRDVQARLRFQEVDRNHELSVVLAALGLAVVGFGTSTWAPPPEEVPPQTPPDTTLVDVIDGVATVLDAAEVPPPTGCGGDAGEVAVDDTPSCGDAGGDEVVGCSDSTAEGCSGGDAPDCGSGGSGGGCEGLGSGGDCGSGATPDCAVANARRYLGAHGVTRPRRPKVVRYLPYAALFIFIGGLKWRLRRRAAHATNATVSAAA